MKVISNNPIALVEAVEKGDSRAINAALKTLYLDPSINNKVKEWVRFYGLTDQEPDDILQEAIILLDKSIHEGKFNKQSSEKTYLLGICRNLIRSGVKKPNRVLYKEEVPVDQLDAEQSPEEQMIVEETSEEQKKQDELLRIVLKQLKENCQERLKLYYFKSMTMAQIAQELGLKNANQAKKAVDRCRQKLRDLIQKHPGFSA